MAGIPWTKREIEALEVLCKRGLTAKQIHETGVFNRTLHSIQNKAVYMGFKMGLSTKINVFNEKKFQEFMNQWKPPG